MSSLLQRLRAAQRNAEQIKIKATQRPALTRGIKIKASQRPSRGAVTIDWRTGQPMSQTQHMQSMSGNDALSGNEWASSPFIQRLRRARW